jgi:hypothetical protein
VPDIILKMMDWLLPYTTGKPIGTNGRGYD